MGLIQKLTDKVVFFDTAPLIYYIEENPNYLKILDKLFEANNNGKFLLQTSVITLIEVLVHPMRENQMTLVQKYQDILRHSSTIELFDINTEISVLAAKYRAKYGLRTPDAIQIATAVDVDAGFFLTNDLKLKNVNEIEVLILDELK
jgi:predicted nucleic acid-binding protein